MDGRDVSNMEYMTIKTPFEQNCNNYIIEQGDHNNHSSNQSSPVANPSHGSCDIDQDSDHSSQGSVESRSPELTDSVGSQGESGEDNIESVEGGDVLLATCQS